MNLVTALLIVLIILAFGGGGWGMHSGGYNGWPFMGLGGFVLAVVLIMLVFGGL